MREAAGTAFAKAVLAFPDEMKPKLPEIWPMWLALLDDNVWSVRQKAALDICDLVQAYGDEVVGDVKALLRYWTYISSQQISCL